MKFVIAHDKDKMPIIKTIMPMISKMIFIIFLANNYLISKHSTDVKHFEKRGTGVPPVAIYAFSNARLVMTRQPSSS